MSEQVLLGDIGGTNARFALWENGHLASSVSVPVAEFSSFDRAAAEYLRSTGARISRAALGVAGVVENNRASITNSPWVIDAAELRDSLALEHVRVVNDFEAIAWSLPGLSAADLFEIGGGQRVAAAPAVVLGPGTGLGLACFVPRSGVPFVISGEGGHVTLPGTSGREDAVIAQLRSRFDHASAERAVSGPGLVNLYEALGAIDGSKIRTRDGVGITEAALDGSCPVSREALAMFCAMLGTVAGNAALTFGARGGVYIAGGIAPRITDYLARSQFRARFESKGRFRAYVATVASSVIVHPEPAFVGLGRLAAQGIAS